MHETPEGHALTAGQEWFDRPHERERAPGLRFACTQCGNCCTGPEGYVLISPAEQTALAKRLDLSEETFVDRFTKETSLGRSLAERLTVHGQDCIFLDRTTHPGRAVCGVYEDRPTQCRTWPFWESNLTSEREWERAGRTCPGIDKGRLYPPQHIRIERAKVKI